MAARSDIPEFRVSRRFEAPRDLVFSAWSDPAHLAEWWGPAGFDLRTAKLEFSPGGIFHYAQKLKRKIGLEIGFQGGRVFLRVYGDVSCHGTASIGHWLRFPGCPKVIQRKAA